MRRSKALVIIAIGLGCGCGGGAPEPSPAPTGSSPPSTDPTPLQYGTTWLPAFPPRLIFIAIDSLHPAYLDLDAEASGPGSEGNWLMPNVRTFLRSAAFWPEARGHAPYATDMNHLNVLAGASSGLTGVVGVSQQVSGWNLAGAVLSPTHLSRAFYPDGTPVQTLFDLLKASGSKKTAFIANKGWVAEMYTPGAADIVVTGSAYPSYLPPPTHVSWHDNPASDPDAACDPESLKQTAVLALMGSVNPASHPRDAWIADAALQVMARERPDMAYILLGDLDHGQHFLGSVANPAEWYPGGNYVPPAGCAPQARYQLVSRRNPSLYKDPALDLIHDVDLAFARLMAGLEQGGLLQNAVVVVLSDHAMTNHLYRDGIAEATDVVKMLDDAGLAPKGNFYFYGASSIGALYWRPAYTKLHPNVAADARAELLSLKHLALNPETGALELPWYVLDRAQMQSGRSDLGIDPMELYNSYFVDQGVWPDLVVFAKSGWSLPSGSFNVGGGGAKLVFNAGHGAPDTAPVVVAVRGLSYPAGARCADRARLADIGQTIATAMGWSFKHTVGKKLGCTITGN